MKTVLTIAGSDASGGAGIQADIKTLTVHKVYATSCITALTAQNTKGITGIMPVPPDFFEKQMDSVFSDIKPDAVKIGMIASKEQVEIIAKYLQKYSIKQVVADPVMISTALCAPCAIFFQGPDGQHDMNMGVAGSLVVDGKIGAHPLVHKILLHIGPDKGKLLFPG